MPELIIEKSALMNAVELARRLNIGERTLWRMRSSGRLPREVQIGRIIQWVRSEVEAWIEAHCPDQAAWEAMQQAQKSKR